MTSTLRTPGTAAVPLDEAAAEAFAGRLIGALNSACLAVLTSIGHQTGLFDTLSTLPAATRSKLRRRPSSTNGTYVSGSVG